MKNFRQFVRAGVCTAFTAALACGICSLSFAQPREDEGRAQFLSHGRGGFALGVCVGQALAQQGITLSAPVQGQPYLNPPGSSNQQAIQQAMENCRSQFRTGPSPSPSESVAPASPAPAPTSVAPSAAGG